MGAPSIKRWLCIAAVLLLAGAVCGMPAVLARAALDSGMTPSAPESDLMVHAEGQAWVKDRAWVMCQVQVDRQVCFTLDDIVPEWTHVEAGEVIGRLYTPILDEERHLREQELRAAEAVLSKAQADANAALMSAEAELLAAQAELNDARERLAAVNELPRETELTAMRLKLERNSTRHRHAEATRERLRQLAGAGICSSAELAEADHECDKLRRERAHLQALLAEMEEESRGFEAHKAEIAVEKASARAQAAELVRQFESRRQPLLCEAQSAGKVGPAKRACDVTQRRVEALTLRAPATGNVVYAMGWFDWTEKVSRGDTVYFGQYMASIVDTANLKVWARIDERDVLKLAPGDPVTVRFEAIPGETYKGEVEQVLPIITSENESTFEIDMEAMKREGGAIIALYEPGSRIRPGMKAQVSLAASGRPESARPPGREEAPGRPPGLALKGWLRPTSQRFIRAPFAGRVTWAAEQGTMIEAGDVLFKLDPGLQADWREELEGELKRLTCLHEAAQLALELKERQARLEVQSARADVALAEASLDELKSRPTEPERIEAGNSLADAEWEAREAQRRLDACLRLAQEGMMSEADVKRQELRLASAQAALTLAQATHAEVTRGTPELEMAVARADLVLAQTSLRRAELAGDADVRAAQAAAQATQADLAAYRRQAARRREKAEQANVKSPIRGIVLWSPEEGQEVRAGWWMALVAETTRAEVHAAIEEPDYFKVPVGAEATVRLTGLPDVELAGHVSAVNAWRLPLWYWQRGADEKVRKGKLFQAIISLDDEPPACIGMSAIVRIGPGGIGPREPERKRGNDDGAD